MSLQDTRGASFGIDMFGSGVVDPTENGSVVVGRGTYGNAAPTIRFTEKGASVVDTMPALMSNFAGELPMQPNALARTLGLKPETAKQMKPVHRDDIVVDHSLDALITPFGMRTFNENYLLEGETPQLLYARVAAAGGSDLAHAQRIYEYMGKQWFSPATPILSNLGTARGLPISCFLNRIHDSLQNIADGWNESVWMAAKGGGIGTYWGDVREVGADIRRNGKTSGIVPFIKVQESLTLAISQGSLRRGNAAVYIPINHPEIEEYIEMRKTAGGDPHRKAAQLHHGVCIYDSFMRAVEQNADYDLVSPGNGKVVRTVNARSLWIRLLTTRLETGEPYLLFIDRLREATPKHHQQLGLYPVQSNLCTEITLPSGLDHKNRLRTAVCCLSSLNLATYDQWHDNDQIVSDVMEFLDNVLDVFIKNAPPEMRNSVYSAMRERSVGLGVMGFHTLLQSRNIPFESALAKSLNLRVFKKIRAQADAASVRLANERGACPDAEECGVMERFSYKLAIAPTASISILCGGVSAGIEPIPSCAYNAKTLAGTAMVKNQYLMTVLEAYGQNTPDVWSSIIAQDGSVQHLDFLSDHERDVFKTAFELDQRWIIEHAADRAQFIDQAQSINIFMPPNVHKADLSSVHYFAWRKGIKSLYYCRSKSAKKAETITTKVVLNKRMYDDRSGDGEECLACQ